MSLTGNAEGFERARKRWKACATVNSLCIFYRGQRSQKSLIKYTNTLICCCCVCVLSVCLICLCFLCLFIFLCVFSIFLDCSQQTMSSMAVWVRGASGWSAKVSVVCVCVFLLVFLRHVCVWVVWIDSFGANAPSPYRGKGPTRLSLIPP